MWTGMRPPRWPAAGMRRAHGAERACVKTPVLNEHRSARSDTHAHLNKYISIYITYVFTYKWVPIQLGIVISKYVILYSTGVNDLEWLPSVPCCSFTPLSFARIIYYYYYHYYCISRHVMIVIIYYALVGRSLVLLNKKNLSLNVYALVDHKIAYGISFYYDRAVWCCVYNKIHVINVDIMHRWYLYICAKTAHWAMSILLLL